MERLGIIGVIAVTLSLFAQTGAAKSKKARVRAHKKKAFALFEKGDFAGGIDQMERAYGLIPHPGFLLNIAVAYDRWDGHCQESLETFERFFMECEDCKLRPSATKKQAEIEAACRVPVEIQTEPDGASVAIDGAVRGRTPWKTRLLPGRYALVLDRSGHERDMRTVEVKKGEPQTIEVALVPRAAAPPPPPPPPIAAVTETPSGGPGAGTWIAFGAGAAGVVTGAIFTGLTFQKLSAEEEARRTPLPKADIEALQDQAKTNAIVAHVGYGVGAAGILTGVLLLILSDDEPPPVTASAGPGGAGLVGRF